MTTSPPGNPARPPADAGSDRAVAMAAVVGAHGVGGEVRLKVFAENMAAHRTFNGGTLTLTSLRDGRIARFAEIAGRDAAEGLRGTLLTVARASLPPLAEGEYYHVDLIGLAVATDEGQPVGHVAAVENFGAGDILDIEKPDGRRFMVPVTVATIGDAVVIPVAYAE